MNALRVLRVFFTDALTGLAREWRLALPALVTIAAAVAVLGAFLLASATASHLLAAWSGSAELSVFLDEAVSPEQRAAAERKLRSAPVVASVTYVDRGQAAVRFAREFPELAPLAASLDESPFPASLEARLRNDLSSARDADLLAAEARTLPGVVDVRYDRAYVARMSRLVATGRSVGMSLAALLAFAAAMVVGSVVRLSYVSRRDEVEILLLVGTPLGAVRGPFVVEGLVQGLVGGVMGLAVVSAAFSLARARYAAALAEALDGDYLTFFAPGAAVALVGGAALVGACAGWLAVGRRHLALGDQWPGAGRGDNS